MLQQTQVDRVVPRYLAWLERWPTVESLAAALRRRGDPRVAGARLQPARARTCTARRGRSPRRLARRPHRRCPASARTRPRRSVASRFGEDVLRSTSTSSVSSGAPGHAFSARRGAGADGSRRDDLPRAHPALRRMPTRGRVPVARHPRRAGAEAGPFEGSFRQRRADDAARGRRLAARARASSTTRPSARWSETASSSWRTTGRPTGWQGSTGLRLENGAVDDDPGVARIGEPHPVLRARRHGSGASGEPGRRRRSFHVTIRDRPERRVAPCGRERCR